MMPLMFYEITNLLFCFYNLREGFLLLRKIHRMDSIDKYELYDFEKTW